VTGIRRKVYNEHLHNLYCSNNIREIKLRRIMWDRHIARMGEIRMWDSSISFNALRTGAFKLFKCTFPESEQFKSTFILCFFKNL